MMNPSGGATAAKIIKRFIRLRSYVVRSWQAADLGRKNIAAALLAL
jgi:hypothetical protein